MNMHCWESISTPLHIVHTNDLKRFHDDITGGRAFPPREIGKSLSDLVQRIGEYAQMNLSFEHDALNSFLGVLHARLREDVRPRVTGIPSIPVHHRNPQTGLTRTVESLALGLSWMAGWDT